jgi:hypothetical protein
MKENWKDVIDRFQRQEVDVKSLVQKLLRQAIKDTYETEFSRYDMKKNKELLKGLYKKWLI